MRLGLGRTLVVVLLGGEAVVACAALLGDDFEVVDSTPQAGSAPTGSGGQGAAGGAVGGGATGGGTCSHASWPAPPSGPDPGTDTTDVVLAVRQIDFGEADLENGATVGYDLDNRCTCQGEDPSCAAPAWATADHCDGPEGRDNGWASLVEQLGTFDSDFSSAAWTAAVEGGEFTLLVRVSNYNGQANDDAVRVALYPSRGLDDDPCLGASPTPAWDGTDPWPVISSALNGSGGMDGGVATGGCDAGTGVPPGYDLDDPKYVDTQGYVTDWVLVGFFPSAELVLSGEESDRNVSLTAAMVTGRLELVGATGRWAMREGLLVGRWPVDDMLHTVVTVAETGGSLVCTDNPIYPLLKNAACAFPEVTTQIGPETTPCNAVSFGMGFEAEQAELGAVSLPDGAPVQCPPGTDPGNDVCGT